MGDVRREIRDCSQAPVVAAVVGYVMRLMTKKELEFVTGSKQQHHQAQLLAAKGIPVMLTRQGLPMVMVEDVEPGLPGDFHHRPN